MSEESLTPAEMQERIEYTREEWRTLCLIATEPHITPVHPPGTIDRDELPDSREASDEEIESILSEF
jgi:hypothetical protein